MQHVCEKVLNFANHQGMQIKTTIRHDFNIC